MPHSARCIAVFSIAVLLLASGLTCQASAPEPAAAAYVLMEADSGRVLASRNETQERSIASTTKIMTCLVALEHAYQQSLAHLPEAEAPSEEHRLVILDALDRLDRALNQLKPRVRQAFLLAQLDGLSIVQIAQQLEVSRATVERDLAKALGVCYRLRYADA